MPNRNGGVTVSDDRDYSDPDVVRDRFRQLEDAGLDVAHSVGLLAGGIKRIEDAQREMLTLARLAVIQSEAAETGQKQDRRITDKQIFDVNAKLAALESKKDLFETPEQIRARAKIDSLVEFHEKQIEELAEDLDETKRNDMAALMAKLAEKNDEAEKLRAALAASESKEKVEKRERWGRRESFALGIAAIVAGSIVGIVNRSCGSAAPSAPPTHQAPTAPEHHP